MIRSVLLSCAMIFSASAMARSVAIGPTERPAKLKLPWNYKNAEKHPLILMLHGYNTQPELTDLYLGTTLSQNRHGYILVTPKGLSGPTDGKLFWNATPECCDFGNTEVDDVKYLKDLVVEAKAKYNVDPDRVYVMGHSNGGFMAHRLACESDGLFKGVASVAGSTFSDPSLCRAVQPINVLQVHGVNDDTVPFDTVGTDKTYPGAQGTFEFWGDKNNCQTLVTEPRSKNLVAIKWELGPDENFNPVIKGEFLDFVTLDLGKETDVSTYSDCQGGVRTGLWTVQDASHAPFFYGSDFVGKVLDFFEGK